MASRKDVIMKHRLWDMSWMEAEEAFKRSDTAILPVGTFHGHGPTPISIDSSSVAWLAEKVGERTGLVTLPLIPFGENDKQKFYPGSITIAPETLERFYLDVFRSLYRNGVRRIIVLNGHGGNRENKLILGVVSGLSSSLRRLMEGKPWDARRDLERVAGLMEAWLDVAGGTEKRELVEANLLRVRETLDTL